MTYKGMMLSDVPNLAFTLGYTNASWTLKADLTCEYVCRLLNHMDEHGYTPVRAPRQRRPAQRGAAASTSPPATSCAPSSSCPNRAPATPGSCAMNYAIDLRALRHGPLVDSAMEFSTPAPEPEPAEPAPPAEPEPPPRR